MIAPPCIAVVEDDAPIRSLVVRLLSEDGYEAIPCADGAGLDRMLLRRTVDLVILDRMLPGEDGLSICQRLRFSRPEVPILMVTARGDDVDRILGLEVGADDYLPKPFNPRELVARVRAILRRTRPQRGSLVPSGERYAFDGWVLDTASRALTDPSGDAVELTGGEFDLLQALVSRPQRVLNRDQLLDWTRGRSAEPYDRTIDVQLSRLRRKLRDDHRAPRMIRTIRGGGYMFSAPVERL